MKLANPPFTFPLTGKWKEFFAHLTDRRERNWLRRLFGFCSKQKIQPEDLNDEVISAFYAGVQSAGVSRPSQVVRDAIKAWNRLSKIHTDWPKIELTLQNRRPPPNLKGGDLPQSFQISLDAFLSRAPTSIFDAPRRPITSEKTRKDKRQKIYQLATHAVHSGVKKEKLKSIHDLSTLSTATKILNRLWALSEQNPKNHYYNLARQLRYIAESATTPDQAVIARIKQAEARFREKHRGLTLKTRQRLRPFIDPKILSRIIMLPASINERFANHDPKLTDAFAVQSALAIDLLFSAPVEVQYLASLDYKKHIRRLDHGQRFIDFSDIFTQSYKAIKYPLPGSTAALLDLYVSSYLPLFEHGADHSLFVSRHGRRKSPQALSLQIKEFIRRETGLDLTPSAFRHLVAFIYLKNNPQHYETVRELLGHASVETTKEFYQHYADARAFEHYDDLIKNISAEGAAHGER